MLGARTPETFSLGSRYAASTHDSRYSPIEVVSVEGYKPLTGVSNNKI